MCVCESQGFAPFGVIDAAGMAVVDRIYAGDGEKPDQDRIGEEGNVYLAREFPALSWIRSVERCHLRISEDEATYLPRF